MGIAVDGMASERGKGPIVQPAHRAHPFHLENLCPIPEATEIEKCLYPLSTEACLPNRK